MIVSSIRLRIEETVSFIASSYDPCIHVPANTNEQGRNSLSLITSILDPLNEPSSSARTSPESLGCLVLGSPERS